MYISFLSFEISGEDSTSASEPGSAVQSPQRPQPVQPQPDVQFPLLQQQLNLNQQLPGAEMMRPPGPIPPQPRLAFARAMLQRQPRPQLQPVVSQPMQQVPIPQPIQQSPWGSQPRAPQPVQQSSGPMQHPSGGQPVQKSSPPKQGKQGGPQPAKQPAAAAFQQNSPSRPVAQGGALRPPSREIAGGTGTLGSPIALSANHFAVTLKKAVVYHYDVDVKPEPSRTLFRQVFA